MNTFEITERLRAGDPTPAELEYAASMIERFRDRVRDLQNRAIAYDRRYHQESKRVGRLLVENLRLVAALDHHEGEHER